MNGGKISKKIFSILIIISVMLFSSIDTDAARKFSDVNQSEEEINYLVDRGIINGYDNGTFRPNANVTNAQVAIMLARVLNLDLTNLPNPGFKDVPTSHPAYKEIAVAVKMGIFPKGTTFNPSKPSTRQTMARAIVVGLELQGDSTIKFSDVYSSNGYKEYISILADNNITNGYKDGTFKPNGALSRVHFAVFLARALNEEFRPIPATSLSTAEITELHDKRIVTIYTDTSQGSGVLIGEGLVLTNEHVINDMVNGEVIFNDGTTVDIAGVVQMSAAKDLALIKLSKNIKLEPIQFRPYEQLMKGEKVVAIGSPLGLSNTVSEGIISSLRILDGVKTIQTTASLDQGSSGGGLFDQEGKFIGITSSGITDNKANLNFAVSVSELEQWKSIISLPYNSIKLLAIQVTQPSISVDKSLTRNLSIGMTKAQVKSIEKATLVSEDATSLWYTDATYQGLPINILYSFENGKLSYMYYMLQGTNALSLEQLEMLFVEMLDILEVDLGLADEIDYNWLDDESDYILGAYWASMAGWQVKITYDDDASASILIMSN